MASLFQASQKDLRDQGQFRGRSQRGGMPCLSLCPESANVRGTLRAVKSEKNVVE